VSYDSRIIPKGKGYTVWEEEESWETSHAKAVKMSIWRVKKKARELSSYPYFTY